MANETTTEDGEALETIDGEPVIDIATDFSGTHKGTKFIGTCQTATLEVVARHLSRVLDETRVKVTNHGLLIGAVDTANVMMFRAFIPRAAFDDILVDTEGEFGIGISRLRDLLANLDDTAELEMKPHYDEDGPISPSLTATSGDYYNGVDSVIDPDSIRAFPDVPDLTFTADFEIPDGYALRTFAKMKASEAGNATVLTVSLPPEDAPEDAEAVVTFDCKAETVDPLVLWESDLESLDVDADAKVKSPATSDDRTVRSVHAGNDVVVQSTYSTEYLKDTFTSIRKTDSHNDTYRIQFNTEFPMVLSRTLPDGVSTFETMLAPRITSD